MDALPDVAYVYMVRCTGGQLYTGWTNHPAARLKAHQSGKGARYTRAHGAVGFACIDEFGGKQQALTLGVNYWYGAHSKFALNWVKLRSERFDAATGSTLSDDPDILEARIQLHW